MRRKLGWICRHAVGLGYSVQGSQMVNTLEQNDFIWMTNFRGKWKTSLSYGNWDITQQSGETTIGPHLSTLIWSCVFVCKCILECFTRTRFSVLVDKIIKLTNVFHENELKKYIRWINEVPSFWWFRSSKLMLVDIVN